MTAVLKTISYGLTDGVVEADFLAASRAATSDLETLDGFIERRLLRGEDGRWIDSVLWRTRQAADASEDVIDSMPGCRSCIVLMDHQTFEIRHDDVVQISRLSTT